MQYLITCRDDVHRLLTDRSIAHKYDKVELSLVAPSPTTLFKHVDALNKYYFSCGCNTGAVTMVGTLLSYILIITSFSSWSISSFLLLIPIGFFSGLLGKLSGLAFAKKHSKKHLNQLLTIL